MIYKTKETAIKHLKQGELFSNKSFELFRNDRDCVLEALKIGKSFTHYPQEWLGDVELSRAFIKNTHIDSNIHACFSIGMKLLDDKNFIITCLSEHSYEFLNWLQDKMDGKKTSTEPPKDCQTLEAFSKSHINAYNLFLACSMRLKNDKDVCSYILLHEPLSIQYMSEDMRADAQILFFFATGLDRDDHVNIDSIIAVKQLGLPHQMFEEYLCVDEIREYIERLDFSQELQSKLENKETKQTIKI